MAVAPWSSYLLCAIKIAFFFLWVLNLSSSSNTLLVPNVTVFSLSVLAKARSTRLFSASEIPSPVLLPSLVAGSKLDGSRILFE
eukprot:763412-Hanusia_phi.AAC.2